MLYSTCRKTKVFFFLPLHRPNNYLENISIFHLPIFNAILKKTSEVEKILRGHSPSLLHQQVRPMNSEIWIESAENGTIKRITTMQVRDTASLHPLAHYTLAEKLLNTASFSLLRTKFFKSDEKYCFTFSHYTDTNFMFFTRSSKVKTRSFTVISLKMSHLYPQAISSARLLPP